MPIGIGIPYSSFFIMLPTTTHLLSLSELVLLNLFDEMYCNLFCWVHLEKVIFLVAYYPRLQLSCKMLISISSTPHCTRMDLIKISM